MIDEPNWPARCPWCGNGFRPRRAGRPQVFCTSPCEVNFQRASRRWTIQEILAGRLSGDDLSEVLPTARMITPEEYAARRQKSDERRRARRRLRAGRTVGPGKPVVLPG
jgi:hypothetical protein